MTEYGATEDEVEVRAQSGKVTVWSPDANEFVTGRIYNETATYICIEEDTGRQIGGPKAILLGTHSNQA